MTRGYGILPLTGERRAMRVVLQRVLGATVSIGGSEHAAIARGYVVLAGIADDDNAAVVDWMAAKIRDLRLFSDDQGRMNLDLAAVAGQVLVISQFTLHGDASRGRRPSFVRAATPAVAIPLYTRFVEALRDAGVGVATGVFGADMQVSLINDGPVTLILERTA